MLNIPRGPSGPGCPIGPSGPGLPAGPCDPGAPVKKIQIRHKQIIHS